MATRIAVTGMLFVVGWAGWACDNDRNASPLVHEEPRFQAGPRAQPSMRTPAGLRSLAATNLPTLVEPAAENLGDVNASDSPGTQSEISIAVDRFRPERIVAGAMNLPDGRILTMSSRDGGQSWSQATLPLAPGAQIHADPMVAFDSRGVAYIAHIPVGPGNTPLGIDVNRSVDGGLHWLPAVAVSHATDRDDKVSLTADDNTDSPYRDRVYVAWKWPSGSVFVARSLDQGQTFSRPRLADVGRVSGLDIAVADDGAVYLAFHDNPDNEIRVLRSTNGGESFEPPTDVASVRADWYTRTPSICNRMALVHASIAVDRSSSSNRGDVYVTWSDYPEGVGPSQCSDPCQSTSPCTVNVYLSRSVDGGRSWSSPIIVHEHLERADRYHQWLELDTDGSIYVAYKDTRNDASRMGTDVYVSRSPDCGLSWEPSVRASTASSFAAGNDFQYGDYQGMTVLNGRVYPAWADFRDGISGDPHSEVYVGRLVYQPATNRWSATTTSAGSLLLTYRGELQESILVDAYVKVADANGKTRFYVTGQGATTTVPEPFQTVRLAEKASLSLEIPRGVLMENRDATVTAVLVPTEEASKGGSRVVSPELSAPIENTLLGLAMGCR